MFLYYSLKRITASRLEACLKKEIERFNTQVKYTDELVFVHSESMFKTNWYVCLFSMHTQHIRCFIHLYNIDPKCLHRSAPWVKPTASSQANYYVAFSAMLSLIMSNIKVPMGKTIHIISDTNANRDGFIGIPYIIVLGSIPDLKWCIQCIIANTQLTYFRRNGSFCMVVHRFLYVLLFEFLFAVFIIRLRARC